MLLRVVLIIFLIMFANKVGQCQTEDPIALLASSTKNYETVRRLVKNIDDLGQILSLDVNNRNKFANWVDGNSWVNKHILKLKYDFIIVGSGSAGAVIANRLSEEPEWNILLLEAGVPETLFMSIPALANVYLFTKYNWGYYTEPQMNIAEGLVDKRIPWIRGKSLGGSTSVNLMFYLRGNPVDYDKWAERGNPGWSYNDVLPYFIKSENATLSYEDLRYHGKKGYLSVEDPFQSPILSRFYRGAKELNLTRFDCNSPKVPFGICSAPATLIRGNRDSVARAFLNPVRKRRNLDVITSALVTKILIDKETKTAYGVKFEKDGRSFEVNASKEVIVSAGVFNSPQLLILSGIGPAKHLRDLGIRPIIQDLPVGQYLKDHFCLPALIFLTNRTLPTTNYLDEFYQFLNNGTGPLTRIGGEALIYIKTKFATEKRTQPDIELILTDGSLASDYGLLLRRAFGFSDRIYDGLVKPIEGISQWMAIPLLLHPKSNGYMQLRSKNPRDHPLLYSNYLSDPKNLDVKTLIASIRVVQKLAQTDAFQKIGSVQNPNILPGCERYRFDSDPYWECFLRTLSSSLYHQIGTNRMGPRNDSTSVVDHELRVYGVKCLRVADSSVIPVTISGHMNAPTIMVGEKASDIIKRHWNK